jgi:hypothetical protein
MEKKTRNWIIGIAAVVVLGTVGNLMKPEGESTAATTTQPPAATTNKIDKGAAYGIGKTFAMRRLGKADYAWGPESFTDNGDGTCYVTGAAEKGGQALRWTAELQFLGGEAIEPKNWRLKGYTDNTGQQ